MHNESYDTLCKLNIGLLERYNELTDEVRNEIYYGLGLVALKRYQFDEAYQYLKSFEDENTLLALRGLGREKEARQLSDRINQTITP